MRGKNICKLITSEINSQLTPVNFILESNPEAMRNTEPKPVFRVVLIAKQRGKLYLSSRSYSCTVGDIIFLFENEIYHFEGEDDFQYMYIEFKGLRADELFRRFGINKVNRIFPGYDGLIPFWLESLSRATKENIDLVSESILLYTFSRFASENSKVNNCISTIMEITEDNFSDSNLSMAFIAEQLGYNAKYLSHIFKKETGMGYTEYLQMFRIKYAISLFENGLDSIKNVAFLSGYSDPLYFSTVFKNKIGISPKNYIKELYKK